MSSRTAQNVLIVGAGVDREFGFRSLKEAGYIVGVIDDLSYIPVDFCDWVYGFAASSISDIDEVISSSGISWDLVVCWGEYSLSYAVAISQKLAIPGPVLEVANFRYKPRMRELLRASGRNTPAYYSTADPTEAAAWFVASASDCVVKPVDYAGSSGVRLIKNGDDPTDAIAAAISKSPSGHCIIENKLAGAEYSVETISQHGNHHVIAITQKYKTPEPFFVELGHTVPADVPPGVTERIKDEVQSVLTSFGMTTGASHTEVIVTETEIYTVESAGRLGGDFIPKLVHEAFGINLYQLEIQAILGERLDVSRRIEGTVSSVRFFYPVPGSQIVWPKTSSIQGTALAQVLVDLGHWYPFYVDSPTIDGAGRRPGYCLLTGTKPEVDEALRLVHLLSPAKEVEA